MDLTLEGKTFINGRLEECCIGIANGKISAIKKILKGDTHLNFGHNLLLPAGIDIHVHLRDPGLTHKEDFSTGTMAAAFGGISCIFDMPNTIPSTTSMQTLSDKIRNVLKKTCIDFGIYIGVTDDNYTSIIELAKKCCGFKIYLGETTHALPFTVDNLAKAFKLISATNKPVLVHAEDHSCLRQYRKKETSLADHLRGRPVKCEVQALKTVLNAGRAMNMKMHICHISSRDGLNFFHRRLPHSSGGVTPHHLLFTANTNLKPQTHFKVNPPLRTAADRIALFDAISNSSHNLILESDHAPHTVDEKNVEFCDAPSGVPGIETSYPLLLALVKQQKLALQRLISIFCEKPAELFGLSKGKIEVGRDADFIVVSLKDICTIQATHLHSKCGWTPFEGMKAIFPHDVFVRGERIINDRIFIGSQGFGTYMGHAFQ
jgi:dihydroorotase